MSYHWLDEDNIDLEGSPIPEWSGVYNPQKQELTILYHNNIYNEYGNIKTQEQAQDLYEKVLRE